MLVVLLAREARAADAMALDSVGARLGLSAHGAGKQFSQGQVFGRLALPRNLNLGANWRLEPSLSLGAGLLSNNEYQAGIFDTDFTLLLRKVPIPVSFEAGLGPTVLTEHDFGTKDLGSLFQFTSHGGINVDLASKLRLGYRFQHMSNGGLASPNPGLNTHMLCISWLF